MYKDKQERNNAKKIMDSLNEAVARYNISIKFEKQLKPKHNVPLNFQSSKITGSDNKVVSNKNKIQAVSITLTANTNTTQDNTIGCCKNMLKVPLYSKSMKNRKHDTKQKRHFLTENKKREDDRIISIKNKQIIQDLVQMDTDNAIQKENKNKIGANKSNKANIENIHNVQNVHNKYQQHKETGKKVIKSNMLKKAKNTNKMSRKKSLFSDFIPVSKMEKILKSQEPDNIQYVKGILHVNNVSSNFAYLRIENEEESDLLIIGAQNRNRTFDGDLVVASINPKNVWFKFSDGRIQKTGKIVCILEALHPRTAVGHLKRQNSLVICHPRDQRIPMINILHESLPSLYFEQSDQYENIMFYVKIDSWKQYKFASGRILSIVGEDNDIEAELKAILFENNLNVTPYKKELLKGLPDSDVLTDDDIKNREDWRNECVFSIDPATAVDIDDLLSCKVLKNGNYEIGVHISDVTHYLKFSSLLDLEVSKRANSVYMPHKVYHMLPEELCQICSLHAGKDRLAFSIIWEMTPDAEVVRHRFAKTVVRSCCQMSYDLAQIMIENPEKSWKDECLDIKGNYTPSMLCDIVNQLFKLSSKMRSKRFENGALSLHQPKLQINLDSTFCPKREIPTAVNYYTYKRIESHSLVEEFMLLANTTTANQLYTAIPETAFLRIHKHPFTYTLNSLCETLQKYGFHLNSETAGALHASIHRYVPDSCLAVNDPMIYIIMVIINLCSKTMKRAEYVCASTIPSSCSTIHYALNVQFYTHFTSPIRRYSDCVVHRLLSAVIENKPLPKKWNIKLCSRIAANCNVKKYNAKLAQEQSIEVFFAEMVGLANGFKALAIISNVKKDNIDIILCDTGIKLKMNLKEIQHIATISYSADVVPTITINWKKPFIEQVINLFSFVQVWVEKIDKILRLKATLLPSSE